MKDKEAEVLESSKATKEKKKVKKITIDGIEFDSKLESEAYLILKRSGLSFEMQVSFPTLEKFKYKDAMGKEYAGRSSLYTPDFVVEGKHVIEIKGWHRNKSEYMLRKKIFLHKYHNEYTFIEITKMNDLKELVLYLTKIKNGELVEEPKKTKRKVVKDE